jgi:hypothetical protein
MNVKFESLIDEEYLNTLNYQTANHRTKGHSNKGLLDVPIVGIDGEGYNSSNDHHYDLIVAAGESWVEHLSEDVELKPEQIFDFLLSLPKKYGKALYFIYGGSYDFNMWVKRMGDRQLKRLALTGRTKYQHYSISWKPKREIIIKDKRSLECNIISHGKNKGRHKHTYSKTIHIYDVIGFFQMSFVAALADWKTVDLETIDRIAQMKALRGQFDAVQKERILGYCIEECQLLVKLGTDFRTACIKADIKPHNWYGAGALAATLMRNWGIKEYIDLPVEVKLYALHAYFGGRTEISYQGRLPHGGYQYDINSAYPTAMVDLPCMVHGEWFFCTNSRDNYHQYKYGMWRVTWNTHGELWNPFPWRDYKGRIYYPDKGEGIYHRIEIDAAIALYPTREITVHEGWVFEPKCDHQPFRHIPERAAYRLKLKAEKNPAAKPLKLGLNSLYGKTAQSLGKNPPYQNFFWAGYITAATRAKLLDAIRYCTGSIYSVATDGLISTVEIDELVVGQSLGTWEKTKIVEGFLVKPGVYKWLDNAGDWHYGTRGFTKDEAKWDEIEDLWDNKKFFTHWRFPANRFMGLLQSYHRGEGWRDFFGKWITADREMRFHPAAKTRSWPFSFMEDASNAPSFIKLKYDCACKDNLSLSAPYNKVELEGLSEFLTFLIDEDQP